MRRFLKRLTEHGELTALVTVIAVTAIINLVRPFFDLKRWSFCYLLIITLIGRAYGVRAAVVAAVLSFFAWNYFFDVPFGTLYMNGIQDWVTLCGFLFVGLFIGIRTGQMREKEATAIARERETAMLNRLSTSLVSISSTEAMVDTMLQGICENVDTQEAILFVHDASTEQLNAWRSRPLRDSPVEHEIVITAQWVVENRRVVGVPEPPAEPNTFVYRCWRFIIGSRKPAAGGQSGIFLPVQTIKVFKGVLYVAPHRDRSPYSLPEMQLLVAVTNLIASFFERQQLEAAAFAGEALREVDKLKSTLISSVSHELKTPLAAINATVTNLLSHDVNWRRATIVPELETLHGAVERLSDNINALVDLSRLQADAWKGSRDWYELQEILGAAMMAFSKAQRARVTFQVPEDLRQVRVDFHQLTRVFHHLLENAFAYTPESSQIHVGASEVAEEIHIWVEDAGPGIPAEEREHVFEKFYRGAGAKTMPTGTGLGLAIASEIVRAHQGRIWVDPAQSHGARFVIALPRGDRLQEIEHAS